MCEGCWVEQGSPTELPPTADRIKELLHRLYEDLGHGTGGPLHVAVDDYNLDDESQALIPSYRWDPPIEDTDGPYSPETRQVCDELSELLQACSEPERYAVLYDYDYGLPGEDHR